MNRASFSPWRICAEMDDSGTEDHVQPERLRIWNSSPVRSFWQRQWQDAGCCWGFSRSINYTLLLSHLISEQNKRQYWGPQRWKYHINFWFLIKLLRDHGWGLQSIRNNTFFQGSWFQEWLQSSPEHTLFLFLNLLHSMKVLGVLGWFRIEIDPEIEFDFKWFIWAVILWCIIKGQGKWTREESKANQFRVH